MRWLIIEDSLESRKGHWFEYLEGFCRELPKLGDKVTLLVSRKAEPFIQARLSANPVLPESAYAKMSDGSPGWRRVARIPIHAWRTFWTIRGYLRHSPDHDLIFVPTVIVHHLLAWAMLVKFACKKANTRVLLFFPGLPIRQQSGMVRLDGSPTSKLMHRLFLWMEPEIRSGKVMLGVETQEMKQAANSAFKTTFTYFPHPVRVNPEELDTKNQKQSSTNLTFACYGAARHEKGSDVLVAAMEKHLRKHPESRVKFVLQWLDDFHTNSGRRVCLPEFLQKHPRVEIVNRYFADGEYARRLKSTQALLLPYRCSSYSLRVSRVLIEAIVNALPVVVTQGTTLAEQAKQFGAGVCCKDENTESLLDAMETMELNYEPLAAKARGRQELAQEHFSVACLRANLNLNN